MNTRRNLMVGAELGLLAVTLAAVLGMGRLFAGGGWLGPIALSALAAHGLASLLRRRGFSLVTAGLVMLLGAAVITTWAMYWSTTRMGLPTGDTWNAMQNDLDAAWSLYQDVVAPTRAEPGFVVASCLAIWVVAFIADWAAFRLWVPFEATLPAGTLFLFTALLGEDAGRGWAVAAFAGSVIGFLLLHRMARQDGSSHWVADRRVAGNRSLLIAGTGLGIVAVLVGTFLGPSVPGASSASVVDITDIGGDDSRETVSPFVELRSRLVEQAAVEVFRVESPVRAYWRLTSLEDFDGSIWGSTGSFGSVDAELPEAVDSSVESEVFEQRFTISALARIWLPSAYEPRALAIEGVDVRYDEDSATLIVDNDVEDSDGLTYEVTSRSPRIAPEDLSGTADEIPGDIRDDFLDLPEDFSPRVEQLAQEVVGNKSLPADQAHALQDYLRDTSEFSYSLEKQPVHSDDPLEDFLFENKIGYCEQFAGAFAAMARSVGLPSRVAVGFTPGEEDPSDPGTYVVRGEYAHAWPEVYIAGAGWVLYEPTPGRGAPNAESYTDVPEEQAAPGDGTGTVFGSTTETTEDPNLLPTTPTSSGTRNPDDPLVASNQSSADTSEDSTPVRYVLRPLAKVLPILLGLVLAYVVLFPLALAVRRRRRRSRASSPLEQVQLAWTESVEHAAIAGFDERSSDTYVERALRLGQAVPEAADPALTLVARLEVGIYSAEGSDPEDATVAWEAAQAIGEAARAQSTTKERLQRWFDPRWLIRGWQRDRALRQRRITLTPRGDLEAERELVGSDDRG